MEQYHVLEMIGEGSFGRVYKGRRKFSGQVVALKFIPKVGRSEKELRSLKREIEIMRGLKHPHIVLLLDSFETEREVVVVTEYAEGELFQILEDDGCLPESQVRKIACQLVSALYYLHSNRILHRDMKPQNILLGKGGVVKLCDFGFARAMSVSTLVLTSIKGTPLYMSPELVEEKPYDHTSDLWSLGCILYELHTGAPPFYTNSIFHLVQLIVKDPVKWPENMSEGCMSFLKGLLTKDPQKRLAWPDLLKHPYVEDGVVVLSDESSSSPLTVMPSPDVQALKQQQAAKKAVPRSGEGKLLRRAKEQRDKERRSRQVLQDSTENGKAVCSSQPRSKTAPAGEAPTSGHSLGSTFTVCRNSAHPAANQHQANGIGVARVHSASCKGPISRDYEREFPSVEVGPRQVLKRSGPGHTALASVRMDSDERDADSDEEWQGLAEVTDWANHMCVPVDPPIHQKLKGKLLQSKDQILAETLEEPSSIVNVFKLLKNIVLTSKPADARRICEELDLSQFLFSLIEEMLSSPEVMKKPWSQRIVGELMAVLLASWEKNPEWEIKEKRAEDLCQLFMSVLLPPDPNRLAPLAAAVLSLFAHHGVCVKVQLDRLTALLESLLSGPIESYHPLPAGWGMCDSVLALTHQFLSESESSVLCDFLNSECWSYLWTKVCTMLQNTAPRAEILSDYGLYVFLSLALFTFSSEPYDCVALFFDDDKKLTRTLSLLLTADSSSTELKRGLLWGSSDMSSLPMMSCHLLCFPFSLELPQEKMKEILHSYQSLNVVTGLVQVLQTQSPALLELPLSLLCRLCLSSPQCVVPSFTKAAQASGFLPQSAETGQTQNHLKQSGSAEERPRHNGFQRMSDQSRSNGNRHPKGGVDMVRGSRDNCRGTRDPPNAQSQLSKSKPAFGKLRERRDQPRIKQDHKVLTAEHLQGSVERHGGSVEELLDSLELHDCFSHLKHLPSQHKRSMSWLIDSLEQPLNNVAHSQGDRRCPVISEIKGQSLEPVVRTASSLLSELLLNESFCGCAMQLLTLLSQTANCPAASVLPVDPSLLRSALGHSDDGVRAAACGLLSQLEPDWVHCATGTEASPLEAGWTIEPSLFQDLLSHLADPAPDVRRIACKAVVKWLNLMGRTEFRGLRNRDQHLQDGPGTRKRTVSGPDVKGRGNRGVEAEGIRPRGKGDAGSPSSSVGAYVEGEEWVRVAIGAACPAVSLLSDSDAVIRRRACVILGNMAVVGGGDRALISADAPRQLLRVARGDSHHAVRRQALATLCAIGQLDELQQALKSIDAGLTLHHASQGSSLPSNYRWPVSQLNGPNTGKT
ncbi:serine/threonine-protein kinase 36 [Salminus brasiliensis]|uniref:serine/threonine-protein kinase 36 n=1 Tax=Salminus brasiliensis TaxID=930266 RepID=UPI003B834640